jgi:DNA-binding response OmpR family regulator
MQSGDIFIVDDNPNNLALLAGILRQAGYHVRAANDGRRALSMVAALKPDLIMLDITMPNMDGFELCRRLKADASLCDVPVIFISALDDVLDKVTAFKVGGVDYVTKPFEAAEVLARVENQLQMLRLRRELEKKQSDLEQRNAELARKNGELMRQRNGTEMVFATLSTFLEGTVLDGKYRLDVKIGEGGFGAVFRGTHLGIGRPVAIKVMRPTGTADAREMLERFRLEGVSACRVAHPNAVEVLDSGVSSTGIAFLVMELLRGFTLAVTLKERGALPVERCLEILIPLCDVLVEAHTAGVIHRDVKPGNIFLHQTPRGEVVKVVDFGIAKLMHDVPDVDVRETTVEGTLLGTPTYMAPERLCGGTYDGRADVYSLGVLAYRMATGAFPYPPSKDMNPYLTALVQLTRDPTPITDVVPDLPKAFAEAIARAMEKDPEARPTARELRTELAAAAGVR